MRSALAFAVALAGWLGAAGASAQEAPATPVADVGQSSAGVPPLPAAPAGTGWQARFERERPAVLRAIEGIPGPAGYERETRYDSRRLIFGSTLFVVGEGLQLLVASTEGIEAEELVPCAGMFWGDYGRSEPSTSESSDQMLPKKFWRTLFAIPVCATIVVGGAELIRGLADPRPVWVRKAKPASAFHVHFAVTDQEARVDAAGYF